MISGDGRWILHLPHQYRTLVEAGSDGMVGEIPAGQHRTLLFDMEADPFETTNAIDKFPEVAARLKGYAERHCQEFYS